ncbi:Ig-like domain-containing protein [Anatilimnocola floriformis]|uniref:Ig-like domain-containing protein n=1 Tax=Anatilimnocola floriformis TaxID=2948575 RepID=UPI0020C30392|nr:Ig-like domain-containing protein [Anatilimnocola floriformis]
MSQAKRHASGTRRSQMARRQFLQVEQLEERALLAGNVTTSNSSGYLYLYGDSQSNNLSLTRVGTSAVLITPRDGTTINGSTTPLTINNMSAGLSAYLGEGDNVLELNGSTTTNLRVSGLTTILTGGGNDTIRFVNYSSGGGLILFTGDGDDTVSSSLDPAAPTITSGGLRVNGSAAINTGNGNDNVSLRNSAFNSAFRLDTSLGNDTVDIRNSEMRSRSTAIYDVLGTDTLNSAGNTFSYSPLIYGFETRTSTSGPTANNDTVTIAEGGNTSISVLTNDVASGGGTLNTGSVAIIAGPTRGTAVVNSDGTITYTNGGGEFATDSFTYTVRDSQGNISNTATVNVAITNVNDLPVAVADTLTANAGTATTLNLGANDTDAEGRLNLGSIVIVQQPTNGTVTVGTNGNVIYTSTVAGATSDSFTYTIADLDGGTSTAGTVNLVISNAPAGSPTIAPIANQSTTTNTATTAIAVTVNDSQTPAGSLIVTATSSNTTLVPTSGIVLGGSGSNRTLTITPAANQTGTSTITVSAKDGDNNTTTTTFVLTVNGQGGQNTAPTIGTINNVTTNQNTTTAAIAVTVNDAETAAGSLNVTATSSNTTLVPNANIILGGSGSNRTLTITPAANQTGATAITVTATDANNVSTTQTFVVTVNSLNTAPTIGAIGNVSTNQNTATSAIAVTVNDAETTAGSLTVAATSSNTTLVPNSSIVLGGSGSNRTLTITPAANQTGTSTITVTATDASNSTTTTTFVLTVNAPNTAPTIGTISNVTTNQNTATSAIPVTVNDAETAAGSLTVTATSSNTELVPNSGIVLGGSGSNRTLTITPAANQSGATAITVTVTDANNVSTTRTFVVMVNSQNAAPTIGTIANLSTNEDTATGAIAVTVNDAETPAGSLLVTATSSDTTLVPNGSIVVGGSGSNRTLTITPAANLSGTSTITVTATDANNVSTTSTFVLTVTPQNDLPTIGTIANQSTNEDTATSTISVNVNDVETAAGSLTVAATSSNTTLIPNANIVVGGSGSNRTLIITPAANQSGTATITVTATDANSGTTTSTFVLTVNAQNDVPTIAAVADISTNEDTAATPFTITIGDIETPNGLTVTATSSNTSVVANLGVGITGTGATRTVIVTPVANASGQSTITLNVSDGTATATRTFVVTVIAQNDTPTITAVNDTTVAAGAAIAPVNFTIGDAETAVTALTVTATSDNQGLVTNGGLQVTGSGASRVLTITPVAGASGTANITIRVADANGLFANEVFAVNIDAQPTISAIADRTINENTAGAFNFTINDAETGGASLLQFDFNGTGTTAASTGTGSNDQSSLNFIANGGAAANLRGAAGSGVSGLAADFAFDNSASDGLFGASRAQQSADFNAIDGLDSFTLSGFYKVPAGSTESIGRQAALIENGTISTNDQPAGFRLRGGDAANSSTLQLTVNRDFTVESSPVFTEIGQYVFFAVTYDGTQSTNNVKFYKGTTASNVQLVDTKSLAAGTVNDESIPLTLGTTQTSGLTLNSFKGLLDDIRIDDSVSSLQQLEAYRTQALTNTSSPPGAAANLTLVATSSNPSLIPVGNIIFSGTGNNRVATVTPVANQTGTSTIRVTVTDNFGQSSFEEFVVTVNDIPTLSASPDINGTEDTPITPFNITAGDGETAANSLTFTATSDNQATVANSGIAITGTGPTRTVTITPVANASSTANITITVNDGSGGTASDTFAVNLTAVNDAPVAVDDNGDLDFPAASNIALMLSGNVLTNDTDADTGTTLSVSSLGSGTVGQPIQMTYGDLTINSNGSFSYTIDPDLVDQFMAGQNLLETLAYNVSDGVLSDSGELTIDLHIT